MTQHIRHNIQIVTPEHAEGRIASIYQQARREVLGNMGDVPEPFTVHSPAPDLLAGVWSLFRETLLVGDVDHGLKQTVATTISKLNACPWCVDAHSIVMYASGQGKAVKAIQNGGDLNRLDPETRALVEWASATLTPGAAILSDPPFSAEEAPEIAGSAVTFHYLNRLVNATLTERFLPTQSWINGPLKRMTGLLFRKHARRRWPPGESLPFLPEAELPDDLHWAEASPPIAGAFGGFAAAVKAGGERSLAPEVRSLVTERLVEWDGSPPGLSRRWVDDALASLPSALHHAARLALLAAFAPYQIDDTIVRTFREQHPGDRTLIEALAWASFAAARQIGGWLVPRTMQV